jgi:C4-type Zn-finger protein
LEVATDRIPHMGQKWDCPDCGYEGSFVVEADSIEDAERIQTELEKDELKRREAVEDDED